MFIKRSLSASDFFEDVRGFRGPDEGFWILVVVVDVVTDGHDELFQVLEDAAPQLVFGQVSEEAFDHIEPAGGGWCEVNVEALMTIKPAHDPLVLMCGVVIADQIDMFFLGDGMVDQAEKFQPLLMPMALLAEAEYFAVKRVQCRKQGTSAHMRAPSRLRSNRLDLPFAARSSGLRPRW